MDNIKNIEENMKLKEEKKFIEEKLNKINKNIIEQKENCNHSICVDLGMSYRLYKGKTGKLGPCQCLFCIANDLFQTEDKIIDAYYYLPQYNPCIKSEYDKKYETIQILALGLIKDNPNISDEELVKQLNTMIQENVRSIEKIKKM